MGEFNNSYCLVCGNPAKTWAVKIVSGKTYAINRCISKKCGFSFSAFRPPPDEIHQIYSAHDGAQNPLPDLEQIQQAEASYPNSTVDASKMISNIAGYSSGTTCKKLLDIGAGYGFFTKCALDNGFEVTALEFSPNEAAVLHSMTKTLPLKTTFEEFTSTDAKYDVILMSHVLEHATDVNFWINKSHDLLKPGGVIAIAAPNFNGFFRHLLGANEPHICPPKHLNFFTKTSISLLLSNHGFEICGLEYVSRLNPKSISRAISGGNGLGMALAPICSGFSHMLDFLRLGMYLHVYAKRK